MKICLLSIIYFNCQQIFCLYFTWNWPRTSLPLLQQRTCSRLTFMYLYFGTSWSA